MNSPDPNIHNTPGALKALQDDIYRDKILRARHMTSVERLEQVFSQSAIQFGMMLSGAMYRLNTTDTALGWQEVRRWLTRLDRVHDHGNYTIEKPTES
ncbi:MAG: hypothetical protein NTW52_10900 [Planctomycetota bacterium]|nr:hypothetical protein [Planctomycetota bacterium]